MMHGPGHGPGGPGMGGPGMGGPGMGGPGMGGPSMGGPGMGGHRPRGPWGPPPPRGGCGCCLMPCLIVVGLVVTILALVL